MNMPDELLTAMWESMDWKLAEFRLAEWQRQLALAALAHDDKRIRDLQIKIVSSPDAKALAVRYVTTHSSGPGIDGVTWNSPAEKMAGALSLNSKNFHPQPLLDHVFVDDKGKDRVAGIAVYYDRAMQKLYDYSLAPVVETWADPKSFAFRLGRSMFDVNEYILRMFSRPNAPEIVYITDVEMFYNSLPHKWLLDNAPMSRKVLKAFLDCGHILNGEMFPPNEDGIDLGLPLSPHLANFALDGIQSYIYMYSNYGPYRSLDFANGETIRFADDIVGAARTEADAYTFLDRIRDFLRPRGLRLSERKTIVANINDGFTFLGRTYKKENGIVRVFPSEEAIEKELNTLQSVILSHRGSQRSLIETVNRKLNGWAKYHRYSDAYDAFRRVDAAVNGFLVQATIAKHPRMNEKKVIDRYWFKAYSGRRIFAVPDKKEVQLLWITDTMLVNYNAVDITKNPYIDLDYFENRSRDNEIQNVAGKYKKIWARQEGLCHYCHRPILPDQQKAVVPIFLSAKAKPSNLAYIHKLCERDKLYIHHVNDDVDGLSVSELLSLMTDIEERVSRPQGQKKKAKITEDWKHIKLKEFFADQTASSLTLSFRDIEKIEKQSLPITARRYSTYWYRRDTYNTIAEAWLTEGYVAEKIDLKKEKIKFKRSGGQEGHIDLPEWCFQKVPRDIKYQVENYLLAIGEQSGLGKKKHRRRRKQTLPENPGSIEAEEKELMAATI